jgi:hypothetical protein
MNLRKRLLLFIKKSAKLLKEKGQSLVEFVLLLAVISGLSYGFVAVINRNVGSYWEYCVNLVIHDKPGVKTAIID